MESFSMLGCRVIRSCMQVLYAFLLHHPCWGKASVGTTMPQWHALPLAVFTWVGVSYLGWGWPAWP